jgi:hypothetical protein
MQYPRRRVLGGKAYILRSGAQLVIAPIMAIQHKDNAAVIQGSNREISSPSAYQDFDLGAH